MTSKLMICVVVVMLTGAAEAQRMNNPFSIGPHFGYYEAKDADNGNVMLGGAMRLRLTDTIKMEGSIDYRQEEYRDNTITTTSWPVLITGLFYPTEFIYGAIGIGWYNTSIDYHNELARFDDKSTQQFGWHFGAGVEFPFGDRIKIASDFRYTFLDYDFGEVPGTNNIKSDYFIVTAGLFFSLN